MKYFLEILTAAIFVLLIFTVPIFAEDFEGKCVGVSDGDTISVMHNGVAEKVRLNGIDCPEKAQPFGNKAKQFTSDMAYGKIVKIIECGKDRYGRTIGDVILPDGKDLNQELVKAGLAWWFFKYSKDKTLEALEKTAREAKIGLWADSNAVPPWDWRKKK